LYYSPSINTRYRVRLESYAARMGPEMQFRIMMGYAQRHRPFGRSRLSYEDVTWVMDMMCWHGLDLSGSGQESVDGSCEHGNKPSGSINFRAVLE
jgi:hypothetical protein